MKKLSLQLLVLLPMLFGTAKMGAQISMGADATPKSPFSVLEPRLKNSCFAAGGEISWRFFKKSDAVNKK